MTHLFLSIITGWTAVLTAATEVALPYMLRSAEPQTRTNNRMLFHYWLGYGLIALVLAHTFFVMGPVMGRTDALGIWAATLALCLLFLQLGLGLLLKDANSNQRQTRRWHFWNMVLFLALILIHVMRNA